MVFKATIKFQCNWIWEQFKRFTHLTQNARSTATADQPHLKSRISHNHYITISIQKISSNLINSLFKIKQILGSRELKRHGHIFTMPNQKSLNRLSAFLDSYQHEKNLFYIVGSNAKERISKRVFQENKARQIFRKTSISYPWYAHLRVRVRG